MIPSRPSVEPTPRGSMSLTKRLASCLAQMRHPDDPKSPLVPGADRMTDAEIIAAVRFDHRIPLAIGGKDHPSNIVPLPTRYHETVKTPRDLRVIAKSKRVRAAGDRHAQVLVAKSIGDDAPRNVKRRQWPSRPFPKRQSARFGS